ncbi:MAG: inosine/xanthosine triphosphatase [Candidatus Acidiferrales bacterium]
MPIVIAVGSARRPKLDAVRDALDALWPNLAPKSESKSESESKSKSRSETNAESKSETKSKLESKLVSPAASFEIVGIDVPSGVRETPLSRAESMAGARNRAEALVQIAREEKLPWQYFVGLEGGLDVIEQPLRAERDSSPLRANRGASPAHAERDASPARVERGGSIVQRAVFLSSWAYVTDGSGRGAFGQSGAIELPEPLAAQVLDRGVSLSVAIDAFAAKIGVRDAEGAWGVLTAGLITRRDSFRIGVINAFAPFFNAGMYASAEARAHHGSA